MREFQRMPEPREEFVDPADVWDPELTSPIQKIIGGLVAIAITTGLVAWGADALGGLAFLLLIGIGLGLGPVASSIPRLRAYLRYEAWIASPEPAPRHIGSLIVGSVLIAIIVAEFILMYLAWFAP